MAAYMTVCDAELGPCLFRATFLMEERIGVKRDGGRARLSKLVDDEVVLAIHMLQVATIAVLADEL